MNTTEEKKIKKRVKIATGLLVVGGIIGYLITKYDKRKPWIPKGIRIYDTDDRKFVCNETTMDKQYIEGKLENVSASKQHLRTAISKLDKVTTKTSEGVKEIANGKVKLKTDIVEFLIPKARLDGITKLSPHAVCWNRISCGRICEDQLKVNTRSLRESLTGISVGIVNGIERGDISKKELGNAIYNLCKTSIEEVD